MRFPWTRFIAGTTLFFFMASLRAHDLHAFVQTEVSAPNTSVLFQIPAELGSIQTQHLKVGKPLLIHIVEAHGQPEVQKNIAGILESLQLQYGIQKIFLEGSAFQLRPELLQKWKGPDDSNQKMKDLLDQSIATGPELFLLHHPKIKAEGIEDLEAYLKNGKALKSVLIKQKENESVLSEKETQLKNLQTKIFSKDLQSFLNEEEKFEKSTLSLDGWLESLRKFSKEHLKAELDHPLFQFEWPMLVRFFTLKYLEKQFDQSAYEKEKANFLKQVGLYKGSQSPFIQSLSDALSSQNALAEPRLFFEEMVEALPSHFPYGKYPNVNAAIGMKILHAEIQPQSLHAEMEKLTNKIEKTLAVSSGAKKLLEEVRAFKLIRKAWKLNLTPEEYQNVLEGKKIPGLPYEEAISFYQQAQVRDQFLIKNLSKKLPAGVSVVITGGFHQKPIEKYFSSEHSYISIMPAMKEISNSKKYFDVFLKNWNQAGTFRFPERLAHTPLQLEQLGFASFNRSEERRDVAFFMKQESEAYQRSHSKMRGSMNQEKHYDRLRHGIMKAAELAPAGLPAIVLGAGELDDLPDAFFRLEKFPEILLVDFDLRAAEEVLRRRGFSNFIGNKIRLIQTDLSMVDKEIIKDAERKIIEAANYKKARSALLTLFREAKQSGRPLTKVEVPEEVQTALVPYEGKVGLVVSSMLFPPVSNDLNHAIGLMLAEKSGSPFLGKKPKTTSSYEALLHGPFELDQGISSMVGEPLAAEIHNAHAHLLEKWIDQGSVVFHARDLATLNLAALSKSSWRIPEEFAEAYEAAANFFLTGSGTSPSTEIITLWRNFLNSPTNSFFVLRAPWFILNQPQTVGGLTFPVLPEWQPWWVNGYRIEKTDIWAWSHGNIPSEATLVQSLILKRNIARSELRFTAWKPGKMEIRHRERLGHAKVLFFDWDGTLQDSDHFIDQFEARLIAGMVYSKPNAEQIQAVKKHVNAGTILQIYESLKKQKRFKDRLPQREVFLSQYREGLNDFIASQDMPLIREAKEFVEHVSASYPGVRRYVVTMLLEGAKRIQAKKIRLYRLFHAIYGEESRRFQNQTYSKAEVIRRIQRRHRYIANQMVILENSTSALRDIKQAHPEMITVALANTPEKAEAFRKLDVDIILHQHFPKPQRLAEILIDPSSKRSEMRPAIEELSVDQDLEEGFRILNHVLKPDFFKMFFEPTEGQGKFSPWFPESFQAALESQDADYLIPIQAAVETAGVKNLNFLTPDTRSQHVMNALRVYFIRAMLLTVSGHVDQARAERGIADPKKLIGGRELQSWVMMGAYSRLRARGMNDQQIYEWLIQMFEKRTSDIRVSGNQLGNVIREEVAALRSEDRNPFDDDMAFERDWRVIIFGLIAAAIGLWSLYQQHRSETKLEPRTGRKVSISSTNHPDSMRSEMRDVSVQKKIDAIYRFREAARTRSVEMHRLQREIWILFDRFEAFPKPPGSEENEKTVQVLLDQIRGKAQGIQAYAESIKPDPDLEAAEIRTEEELYAATKREGSYHQKKEELDRQIKDLTPEFEKAFAAGQNDVLENLNRKVVTLLKQRLKLQLLETAFYLEHETTRSPNLLALFNGIENTYSRLALEYGWRYRRAVQSARPKRVRITQAEDGQTTTYEYADFKITETKDPKDKKKKAYQLHVNRWRKVKNPGGGESNQLLPIVVRYPDLETTLRSQIKTLVSQNKDYDQIQWRIQALEFVEQILSQPVADLGEYEKDQIAFNLQLVLVGNGGLKRGIVHPKKRALANVDKAISEIEKGWEPANIANAARFVGFAKRALVERQRNISGIRKHVKDLVDYIGYQIRRRDTEEMVREVRRLNQTEKWQESLETAEMVFQNHFSRIPPAGSPDETLRRQISFLKDQIGRRIVVPANQTRARGDLERNIVQTLSEIERTLIQSARSEDRTQIIEVLNDFGIQVFEDGVSRPNFSRVPQDVAWVMADHRPEEFSPIATTLAELPDVELEGKIKDLIPITGQDGHGSLGIFLGLAWINGELQPVAIKLFTPDASLEPQKLLDYEMIYAQALDRRGIAPKFYGVIKDHSGAIVGYAMQLIIGSTNHQEKTPTELFRIYHSMGLTPPVDLMTTRTGTKVIVDAGGVMRALPMRFAEYVGKLNAARSESRLFAANVLAISSTRLILAPGVTSIAGLPFVTANMTGLGLGVPEAFRQDFLNRNNRIKEFYASHDQVRSALSTQASAQLISNSNAIEFDPEVWGMLALYLLENSKTEFTHFVLGSKSAYESWIQNLRKVSLETIGMDLRELSKVKIIHVETEAEFAALIGKSLKQGRAVIVGEENLFQSIPSSSQRLRIQIKSSRHLAALLIHGAQFLDRTAFNWLELYQDEQIMAHAEALEILNLQAALIRVIQQSA